MSDTLFADILDQGLDLRLQVTGRSMEPVIKSGETVIIRKVSAEILRCGDIVYFIDAAGSAVLHRIISKKIEPGGKTIFTTRGDALYEHDVPITAEQILGKALSVEKVMPLIGPIKLDMDSAFCKSLNLANSLYRKARHTFLNRNQLRKIFTTCNKKREQN